VLRRPIIIYGESAVTVGGIEQESDMPGIYLPLLWENQPKVGAEISRSPICLSYGSGHFWALVQKAPSDQTSKVPLVNEKGQFLVVKFLLEREKWDDPKKTLRNYLDLEEVLSCLMTC